MVTYACVAVYTKSTVIISSDMPCHAATRFRVESTIVITGFRQYSRAVDTSAAVVVSVNRMCTYGLIAMQTYCAVIGVGGVCAADRVANRTGCGIVTMRA